MIHKIKSYKLSDYDLLGEGKVAETTDPLDLTDANEAMGKMCEKHGIVACEDSGCVREDDHMHEGEVEELGTVDAEILSMYEEGGGADGPDDQSEVDEDEDKEEGMKMNEGHSRFEELAFGKMRPAPQPGVETDSQVEESHGTLLRRRYFGRY